MALLPFPDTLGSKSGTFPRSAVSSRPLRRRAKFMGLAGCLGSLGWICLFFFLIFASYTSLDAQRNRRLVPPQRPRRVASNVSDDSARRLRITIFSAPRSFSSGEPGFVDAVQEMAVRSWLALSPDVSVVLFGQHPSLFAFKERLGPRVSVETSIDFTFQGSPFFSSMVARSQASDSAISILIDPEIILLPDILNVLHYAQNLDKDWFIVAMPRLVSDFPFYLSANGSYWQQEDGKVIKTEKLQEYLIQNRKWNSCGERLLMAWNTGGLPLHAGVLPPFVYGDGLHNEWLINEVLSSDFRLVFDISQMLSSFYPEYLGRWSSKDAGRISKGNSNLQGNSYLAASYGSLLFEQTKMPDNPIKLVKCSGKYFFVNQSNNTVYSLHTLNGHVSYSLNPSSPGMDQEMSHSLTRLLHFWREKKWKNCIEDINSLDAEYQCSVMHLYRVASEASLPVSSPLSLQSLLRLVADKNKSVVLAVAGESYKDMLMSWSCRLRHLAVKNFIVCALDSETYQFSALQGLPVFKAPVIPRNVSFNNCHFGTECFKRVTKIKSRIVLQILKLGYHVLMSDVDIYWFDNPLPYLLSQGPTVLSAQTDEYNETGPINLPRRLNSGFYFVHSNPPTIAAMEMVVKHASTSGLSEQPSFYDVLCGEGGIYRVGDNRCQEPGTNITVVFLDQNMFPNGAYKGLWEKHDVRSACEKLGCFILHNNWINGRRKKLERQVRSGLWNYDPSSRMCIQSWQNIKSVSHF